MKLARYFYFRVFSYYSNGDMVPYFSTFAIIIVLLFVNLLTVLNTIAVFGARKITMPQWDGLSRVWPILVVFLLYGLFHYYFKVMGKHKEIVNEFRNETPKSKRISKVLSLVFIAGSIGLFIFTLWLRQEVRDF